MRGVKADAGAHGGVPVMWLSFAVAPSPAMPAASPSHHPFIRNACWLGAPPTRPRMGRSHAAVSGRTRPTGGAPLPSALYGRMRGHTHRNWEGQEGKGASDETGQCRRAMRRCGERRSALPTLLERRGELHPQREEIDSP